MFLKAGYVYVAHFAHMPGQGSAECDDYHPANDLRRQSQNPAVEPQGPAIDPLQLGIELEPGHDTRRGLRKWGLRLTVPRANDGHGEIRIDLGRGDVRKISLASLSLGPRTYRVDPTAPDFGVVWLSPEVRPAYRAAVEHRVEGLSPRFATAFVASRQSSKLRCNALRWGESYYFVWRSAMGLVVPPKLLAHGFADNQTWSCSLIALPDTADPEVAAWLERMCDLKIAHARREWALVFPPLYAVDDDGCAEIPPTSQVLLAINPVGEDAEYGGEIACLSGRLSANMQLVGLHRHLVEILVSDQAVSRTIDLTWDGARLHSLALKPYPPGIMEPTVELEFLAGGSKLKAFLHCVSGSAALAQVRDGKYVLTAIRSHHSVHGQLRLRPRGQFDWKIEELSFAVTAASGTSKNVSLTTEQITRIASVIQDSSCDVALDFGPFGRFFAQAGCDTSAHAAPFRMNRALRNRTEWLCRTSGGLVSTQGRPLSTLDDSALVIHLSTVATPPWLMPHRRALERDLSRSGGIRRNE